MLDGVRQVRLLPQALGYLIPYLFTLFIMFNMFIKVPTRTSSAIKEISVDMLARTALVTFKSTNRTYEYNNVSARSIANLLFNPDISLGFWVNNNCINQERVINQGPVLPEFV